MNILHNQHKHLLVANRVVFMIIGVLEAAWAPLVPYVKRAFAIDEGTLGLLMLCSGLGSICSLPLSGFLVNHFVVGFKVRDDVIVGHLVERAFGNA